MEAKDVFKPIEQEWREFAAACIPTEATKTQYSEMRKSFYAGIVVVYSNLLNIAHFKQEVGIGYLDQLSSDLETFKLEVLRNLTERN